jgi:hypothetical protein
MLRKPLKVLAVSITLALGASFASAGDTPATGSMPSAAQIVEKNVAARGGLQAWRSVQTMSFSGKMGAGGNQRATIAPLPANTMGNKQPIVPQRPVDEVQLPFVMELKRPRMQRVELQFNGQTAIQVYDGANGWKLRPFLNRREVEPFTPEELKKASTQADLDGLLVDYAAKGTRVELVGTEKVEDRDTYKLKLTLKDGTSMHVWVDAQTFLETKIEGQPRRLDGVDHPVEIYFRDYRPVNGLQIPFLLETRVLPVAHAAGSPFKDTPVPPEKAIIEKVVVNPPLDASLFSKPAAGAAPNAKQN